MKKRSPDLRKLAKRQRWIIWLVMLSILSLFLPMLARPYINQIITMNQSMIILFIPFLIQACVCILGAIVVILLLNAQGNHFLMTTICGILMLAPCANLVLLLLVNMSATRSLKRAGIRVGFMGVKDEDVERIINPDLCSHCGYNLTGNISGVCSECGQVIVQTTQDAPPLTNPTTPPVSS